MFMETGCVIQRSYRAQAGEAGTSLEFLFRERITTVEKRGVDPAILGRSRRLVQFEIQLTSTVASARSSFRHYQTEPRETDVSMNSNYLYSYADYMNRRYARIQRRIISYIPSSRSWRTLGDLADVTGR